MCEMHNNLSYRNMMDYMGDIPPPEKKRAVKELFDNLNYLHKRKTLTKYNANISEKFLKYIIETVYDEYHSKIYDYSYSGWCVFVKSELIKLINNKIETFKKKRYRIKCGLLVATKLILIYKNFLETSLAPGGVGFLRAQHEFISLC